jgi:hypothetical protein
MAEEDTAVQAEPQGLTFTEEELDQLEAEFEKPQKETPDEEDELDLDDEEDEDEDEDEDEEEEAEAEGKEDDEEEEEAEAETEADDESDSEGAREKDAEEGFELVVDGQPVQVDTIDDLAAWAQKGIHYERKQQENQKVVDDAIFTMRAMVNDPMPALEEIWTQRYGGNNEQARAHIAKLAENYLEPIWREMTAEPAERLKLQQERFNKRWQEHQQRQEAQQQGQFSQEDIQYIQTMDAQIGHALKSVDLPADNTTLRKWMADVMRDGLARGIQPDPVAAAEYIKSQQEERQRALGNSAPSKKDRKKTKAQGAKAAKKIQKAKARRSSRTRGQGQAPQRRRQEPRYMTSREWLNGLNTDLNLEP